MLNNNTNFFINNCDINDSKNFGLEIIANENPPAHITISNSSFYPLYPAYDPEKPSDPYSNGHIFINGANNVLIQATNLYYTNFQEPPSSWQAIAVTDADGPTAVFIDTSYIQGEIVKGNPGIDVRLNNCWNKQTVKTGIAQISSGTNIEQFPHGLTVLSGQAISVVATNSSSFDLITAGISGSDIRLISQYVLSSPISISYRAEVFNT